MTTSVRIFACLIGLAATPPASLAQEVSQQPFETVRSLRALQDQSAQGNTTAHVTQRAFLAKLAQEMAKADPELWKEPRNARSLIVFVLSGGNPSVLKNVLGQGAFPEASDKIAKAALAYAEGRNSDAAQLLAGFDARALEPSMAGHIAIVQAELVAKSDPKLALTYLDQARLLSPGTLIEEAALRREISLLASMGNFEGFATFSSVYLRRFPNSIYAGAFRQQFAREIAAHDAYAEAPGRLSKLEESLATLDADTRRDIYLSMSREAVARGKVAMTRFAGRKAGQLSREGSVESLLSKVYEAAALVATEQAEQGLAILDGIEKGRLGKSDVELLEQAKSVGELVRRLPDDAGDTPNPSRADRGELAKAFRVVELAERALQRADQALNGAGK